MVARQQDGGEREWDEIVERVAAARRAQGLPGCVMDPATLTRIATLLMAPRPTIGGRGEL
jgi:hypothetical protein